MAKGEVNYKPRVSRIKQVKRRAKNTKERREKNMCEGFMLGGTMMRMKAYKEATE